MAPSASDLSGRTGRWPLVAQAGLRSKFLILDPTLSTLFHPFYTSSLFFKKIFHHGH